MKQKNKSSLYRRFSRWNSFNENNIYIVLAVLFIVLCIIFCVTFNNTYKQELESFDESDYKYLTSIVYTIWDEETKSIKIDYIPNNVRITEASFSSSGTNFKCSLIGKNNLLSAPFVSVHISENFSIEVTHYMENEFLSSAKSEFILFCIASCIFLLLAEVCMWWLIKILIYFFCGLYDLTKIIVIKLYKS